MSVRHSAALAFYLRERDQGCADAEAKALAITDFKRVFPGRSLSPSTIAKILRRSRPRGRAWFWRPVVLNRADAERVMPELAGCPTVFMVATHYEGRATSKAIERSIQDLLARGIPSRKLVAAIRKERILPFSAGHLRKLVRFTRKRLKIHHAI